MHELSGTAPNDATHAVTPTLLHVDEHLLVIEKPAGMLSVPGRGEDKQDCVSARVQREYADALVVHRLDMSTSGLFVMARGADSQWRLSAAFSGREVFKRYEAVVAGILAEDQGVIEMPLLADWPNRPRQRVDFHLGKPSLTHWRVMARNEAAHCTRLELEPVTGRTHQLRVHLQAIGHPILGDALYAPSGVQERAGRLMLHATRLAFAHRVNVEPSSFHSPAPF